MIYIADAGEVTLHERFPLIVVGDPFVPRNPVSGAGVGEVIFDVGRKLNLIEWIEVEVFLRDFERDVWSKKSYGEELWFGGLLFEFFDRPINDEMISVAFLGLREGRRSEKKIAQRASSFEAVVFVVGKLRPWPVGGNGVEGITPVFVPGQGIVL